MIRRRAPRRRHLKELRDDIKKNGLRDPLLLLDGKLLDGRNRYRACRQFASASSDGISTKASAMIGAKLETTKQGCPGKGANLHVSRDQVATPLM